MNTTKRTLFYLIGDGYIGSSLKNLLRKNNAQIIVKNKEDDIIPYSVFKKWSKNKDSLFDHLCVIYLAGPDPKKYPDFSPEDFFFNIEKDLLSFYNQPNCSIIYGNSAALKYEKLNEENCFGITESQRKYIEYNQMIVQRAETVENLFNLFIPYVYDSMMKKEDSLYYKIKHLNFKISSLDKDKVIFIQNKNVFRGELLQKILKIMRDSSISYKYARNCFYPNFNGFEIKLKEFQEAILRRAI